MTDDMSWLEVWELRNPRMVGGVLCAVSDYVTTRAIVVGANPDSGYERRYCYQNRAEADAALAAYTNPNQHPPGMWIKVKGEFRGRPIDALNPRWPEINPWDEVAPE